MSTTETHYYNPNAGDGTWYDIIGDIYSGIAVGIGHPKWFILKTIDWGWKSVIGSVLKGSEDGNSITNEDGAKGKLKVVGVGYGRTGTYSLALALDVLGYPTLHTQHLYENGEIFDMWVKEVFQKSIVDDEVTMGKPQFDLLPKHGFAATMDMPFALYYDQIREQYPDCKFILTVRESSDVWFKSWNILTQSITQPARYTSAFFSHVKKLEYYMRWLFSVVNSDKKYLSHPFPLPPQIKENAIASYETHNQRVRDFIPPSQLLEYDVRQGWEPLCQFLEIPHAECPATHGIPFPKSNSTLSVRIQSFSSFLGPLMAVTFVLFSMLSLLFRKITGMSVVEWCCVQMAKILVWISPVFKGVNKRVCKNDSKMD